MQIVYEWKRSTPNRCKSDERIFLRNQYDVPVLYFDFSPMLR